MGVESYSRSKKSECLFSLQNVQNVLPPIHPGGHSGGRFSCLHRFDRGLSPYTDYFRPLDVPVFLLCRNSLPVQGPAVRPSLSTQSLYQVSGSIGCASQVHFHETAVLPRLYSHSAFSFSRVLQDLQTTIQTLQEHGFLVNFEKSHLVPTTHLLHLGEVIDTRLREVFLSQNLRDSLVDLVTQIQKERMVPVFLLSQLLGKMISCIAIVSGCSCTSGPCSGSFSHVNGPAAATPMFRFGSCHKYCSPSDGGHLQLCPEVAFSGSPFASRLPEMPVFLAGAPISSHTRPDLKHNINWLELRAAHLALWQCWDMVQGHHILLLTENVATKAHVNRRGGTHSKSLRIEAE